VGVIVVLAGTFTYFNTNLFTPDRICHGWVTPDEAADVLGGGVGRVSATEDSETTCVIKNTSWLPGGGDKQLGLSAGTEGTKFPFRGLVWEISGDRHVMTGGTHGAFHSYGGWALLPASCTKAAFGNDPQPVLRAAVYGGEGDAAGMGRLLTSAAKAITSGPNGCATANNGKTPTRYFSPSAAKTTDFDKVCDIAGFHLGKVTGPKGQQVQEQTSGSLKEGLYCDLSFEGDKEGPFARLAIVNDSPLVEPLKSRDFDRPNCGGKETVFAFDLRYADEKERAETGLPNADGLAKAFSGAAREALRCE
jgi:hypothetical protein